MKTKIRITGQPAGNQRLLIALLSSTKEDIEVREELGDKILAFQTKSEAKLTLMRAEQSLKEDEPDFEEISLSVFGDVLNYDASHARIIQP